MAEHPNVAQLRRGYEAFAKGDLDTLGELFDPGVVWHTLGHNPLSGDYKGQDEVFGFFGKVSELSGGTFQLDLHGVFADDEHGVVLVHARGERDGKTLDMNEVHVFHFKDGKTSEFWGFEEDQRAADEFWS